MTPSGSGVARAAVGAEVREVLEGVAEGGHEAAIVDRVYVLFFERRPDVVPLFGVHALAEREQMVQEVFASVLAWCDEEAWLEGNLRSLGASHAEYGVTAEMYPPFVTAFSDALREVLGDVLRPEAEKRFVEVLEVICGAMSAAGDAANERISASPRR